MNSFVQRMLGHYLMNEAEEGEDLPGQVEQEEEVEEEAPEEQPEAEEESEEGELMISLGGEPDPDAEPDDNAAPQYVKDMRKRIREQNKELRELKAKSQQQAEASAPKAPEVGPKPTLDDCDYDADVFEQKLTAWHERKRQAEAFVEEQQKAAQKVQDDWQAKLNGYADQKAQIKLADYDDAEEAVVNTLSQTQQAIIISGAIKPAHLIYALGKNSAKAKELAAITDPVKFAWAAAQLEMQMKVEKKDKQKPAPERTVSGSAPSSGSSDAVLERLRAEAEKTGNYSKVTQYKKQLREKARA